jgi:glutamate-5-semialdehyde dehydrogenase
MDVLDYMQQLRPPGARGLAATARASTAAKDKALLAMAAAIRAGQRPDCWRQMPPMSPRRGPMASTTPWSTALTLNDARIDAMLEGLAQVAALPDPIGEITDMRYRPTGIQVGKMRVPLGVVGMIYESRPNVTIEAASLCLKSGNATILRGGSESIHSNRALAACIRAGLAQAGLPETAVQVVDTTDRAAVGMLVAMPDYVDVIIPRGGKGLIERISAEAKVPVIKHLDGNCHVYIDAKADLDKADRIAFNAKCHRYGVCNAMETLLVHEDVAAASAAAPEKTLRHQKCRIARLRTHARHSRCRA